MAKSKNNLSGLLNSLTHSTRASSIGNSTQNATAGGTLTAGSPSDTRATGLNGGQISEGLTFGRPSSTKTPTATTGTDWRKLLEHAASGGLESVPGGGFGLGSVLGLGSIVSSVTSLFGGAKKQLAPLQEFKLPAAQNLSVSVGSNGSSGAEVASQSLQDQSSQIAQAVKTALLHSSSLNDVIAEI
jgi:hypothetical protein